MSRLCFAVVNWLALWLAQLATYLIHSCQFAAAIPDRERPLSSVETACHGVTKLLQTINKLLQVVAK